MSKHAKRLEYLRGELRAERISYGELAELQELAGHIAPGDVELLEAAGVPEHEIKCGTNIPEFWEMAEACINQMSIRGRPETKMWRDKKFNNVFAWNSAVFLLPTIPARGEWELCAEFKLHSQPREVKSWGEAWRGAVTDAMGWSWRPQTIWECVKGAEVGAYRWMSTKDGSPRKTRGGKWVRVMKVTPHIFTR